MRHLVLAFLKIILYNLMVYEFKSLREGVLVKYLVISDTHNFISNAVELIEKLKPDYCIHLGDMIQDCEELEYIFPRQKFIFVKGNNDWAKNSMYPDDRFFELEGKKFFLCHGHKFHVKSGTDYLKSHAKSLGADIVLFGHTHVRHLECDGDMFIMNPGSISGYGIINIENGRVTTQIKKYEKDL